MKKVLAVLAVIIGLYLITTYPGYVIAAVVLAVGGFIAYKIVKKRTQGAQATPEPAAPEAPVTSPKIPAAAPATQIPAPTATAAASSVSPTVSAPTPAPQPVPKKPKVDVRSYTVKGVFAHEKEIFHEMMIRNPEFDYTKSELVDCGAVDMNTYEWVPRDGMELELVPEPDCKYDPNAVKVVIGGHHIGYIPREKCLEVLELLSSGRIERMSYDLIGGKYKRVDEDYDYEKDKSTYTMEEGKRELGAAVYLTVKPQE